MALLLATATGEQHGLINSLSNSVPFDDFKSMNEENKKYLKAQKKEDSRIVKARYLNRNGKTERLDMHYCKYAGDPIQQWKFIPGYSYNVPLGLVKQVNEKGKGLPKREGLVSVDGNNVRSDGSPTTKDEMGEWLHQFVSENF